MFAKNITDKRSDAVKKISDVDWPSGRTFVNDDAGDQGVDSGVWPVLNWGQTDRSELMSKNQNLIHS